MHKKITRFARADLMLSDKTGGFAAGSAALHNDDCSARYPNPQEADCSMCLREIMSVINPHSEIHLSSTLPDKSSARQPVYVDQHPLPSFGVARQS